MKRISRRNMRATTGGLLSAATTFLISDPKVMDALRKGQVPVVPA